MAYLVSFEDGSSGYLEHHGVKGMKWGVWNAETSAKYGHLKGIKGHEEFVAKYAEADKKAWRDSNGAYSHPNPISKFRANRSQKKLEKARSDLADAVMKYYDQHPTSISPDSNFEAEHKQAVKDLYRRVEKSGWSQNESLISYAERVSKLENDRQFRKAVANGKDAVEHYIQYGTNDRPRSSIEYAAKRGVAVSSEKEGNQYRKLRENLAKANLDFEVEDAKALRESEKRGFISTPELRELLPDYRKAGDRRSKAQKELYKFEEAHRPKHVEP